MSDTSHHVLTGKVDITSNLLVGSSHLFVDTNNNRVGLVTTNPQAGLHVNSNVYVNTDLRVGPAGPNQVVINATAGRIKAASFEGDGSLLQNTPPGAAATIAVGTTTTGAAGTSASVTNSGTTSAAVFDFIIPKGDQGIQGIPGNDGADGAPGADGADGTNYFTLSGSNIYRSTGNVGIGGTNPSVAKLHIGPLNGDHLYLASGNNAYGWKLDTDDQGNGAVPFRIKKRTSDVDTTVLTIKNEDGFVGIGATSPSEKLHVAGNIKITNTTGGLYDNDYQWLECKNDTSWGRFARTARTNGIACYNGIAIGEGGGLVVGSWDSPNALGVGNGKFHGTCYASQFGRTSHSNGYFVGSYNNVGPNSHNTNPIYVIGSNYKPNDTSLGNMYGIGYSHGNFTGYLTSGWGMYVAADGDVRIGLNGSHGHIKNSGHIYCGNTVYLSGTGQGLRSATGNYGTVQTTGGGNGGWEGYSIDGRYVFMSADNNSCGIYNDVDNEWMIICYRNSYVRLYDNGAARFTAGSPNVIEDAGLRIYGVEHYQDYADHEHDYWTNWNQIQADVGFLGFGLYVDNAVRAPVYVVLSDRRIKKDFLEIDDTIALDKLRQLKPTSYKYKDKLRRTTDRVLGFIAQEVAEVLPDAVSITNAVIPNIQCEASVKKIDEEKFEFTLQEPHVVTVGSKLELRAPKLSHMEVEVISVTDDTTFTGTAKDFDIEKVGDRVIVYGEYVNDFHNLDKNAIFTVATAALQEVDRQLQTTKSELQTTKEALQSEKEKVATMELLVASLVKRVGDLENLVI